MQPLVVDGLVVVGMPTTNFVTRPEMKGLESEHKAVICEMLSLSTVLGKPHASKP